MKVINLQQDTPEWLDWRSQGIGASDTPIIMGTAPWSSPYQLWRQKRGETQPFVSDAMKRGTAFEQEAREAFAMETGIFISPLCGQHDQMEWLRASFDGIDLSQDIILEIKVPSPDRFAETDGITDYYNDQIQHQMLVSGCTKGFYYVYCPESKTGKLYTVEADPKRQEQILNKVRQYWQCLESGVLTDDWIGKNENLEAVDDFAAMTAAQVWKTCKEELDIAKKAEAEARKRLIELTGKPCLCSGVRITQTMRKGSYDTKEMAVILADKHGYDLEMLRKPDTSYWKLHVDSTS